MIIQNDLFIDGEKKNIAKLNQLFGNIELTEDENRIWLWLSELADDSLKNIMSVIEKGFNEKIEFERSRVEFEKLEKEKAKWNLI